MIPNGFIYIPYYGVSDKATGMACVSVDPLLNRPVS
jgi:hypothetical protein